jgi:hypothetical protein
MKQLKESTTAKSKLTVSAPVSASSEPTSSISPTSESTASASATSDSNTSASTSSNNSSSENKAVSVFQSDQCDTPMCGSNGIVDCANLATADSAPLTPKLTQFHLIQGNHVGNKTQAKKRLLMESSSQSSSTSKNEAKKLKLDAKSGKEFSEFLAFIIVDLDAENLVEKILAKSMIAKEDHVAVKIRAKKTILKLHSSLVEYFENDALLQLESLIKFCST